MIIKNILDNPQEFTEPNEANEPNKPLPLLMPTRIQKWNPQTSPQDESIKTEPSTPNTTPAATEAHLELPQTLNKDEGEYTKWMPMRSKN
jgi:hypothetical protein